MKNMFDFLERLPAVAFATLLVSFFPLIYLLFGPIYAYIYGFGVLPVTIVWALFCFGILYAYFKLTARFLAIIFGIRNAELEHFYGRLKKSLGGKDGRK